jgi:urocanate hydratase
VLGGAEMLRPVTNALQPFRFVSLADDDHRRLQKLVWEQTNQNKSEQVWMEKLRAASTRQDSAQPSRLKLAGLVGLLAVGLATAAYVLHFGLLR